jgi:hypothetical protein
MTIRKVLIGLTIGSFVALCIYFSLSFVNATDAKLFSIVPGAALCIACWVSPRADFREGLKSLKLFDWVAAAFPPVMVLLISSQDAGSVKVIRAIVGLIFTLSGFVCIRRLTAKPLRQHN